MTGAKIRVAKLETQAWRPVHNQSRHRTVHISAKKRHARPIPVVLLFICACCISSQANALQGRRSFLVLVIVRVQSSIARPPARTRKELAEVTDLLQKYLFTDQPHPFLLCLTILRSEK